MGTPVKIYSFPFISKPFHQTARQNPPKSWAIMGFPVMSVEFHGKRGPNIRSSNTVKFEFFYTKKMFSFEMKPNLAYFGQKPIHNLVYLVGFRLKLGKKLVKNMPNFFLWLQKIVFFHLFDKFNRILYKKIVLSLSRLCFN